MSTCAYFYGSLMHVQETDNPFVRCSQKISTHHWTGDLKQEELGNLACLQRINLNGKERTSLPISRSSPRQALPALGSATIDKRWRISAPECEGCWLLQPIWRCRPNQKGIIWADINTEGAKKKKVQLFSPLLFTWFPWVAPLMIDCFSAAFPCKSLPQL